jgi:hypothetical protein
MSSSKHDCSGIWSRDIAPVWERPIGYGRGTSSSAPPGPRAALYARALGVSVAANLAAGFFLSHAYDTLLWIVIVICAALVRIAEASPVGEPPAAAPT